MVENEYIPNPAVVELIQKEGFDTMTFRVCFEDKTMVESFKYKPGQFVQVSLLGIGEAPISIASSPCSQGFLEFTIRAIGKLTRALHQLKPGDRMYIRGPYGNSFPVEEVKGKDLYFIAGGIGLPPLRSVINTVLSNREDFGRIKILYGARTPDELCFKEELNIWQGMSDIEVLLTVDNPDEGWKGNVGVVTTLWDTTSMRGTNQIAYVCGPPIMTRFVLKELLDTGFREEDIYVTLERYMKCGIGKCGHCNIADKFVCTDGPVFSYRQLKEFPQKEKAVG